LSNTQGVEIDYCPNCKGVWLDRGELEKIIERSNDDNSHHSGENEHSRYNNNYNDNHSGSYNANHFDNHADNHSSYGQNRKNKKGFLSEIFDF
jgi:Zn-finger nucleic acid-binding protein